MNRIFILVFIGLVGFCRLNAQTEFGGQNNSTELRGFEFSESEPVMNIIELKQGIAIQSDLQENSLKSSTASPYATYKHPKGYLKAGYSSRFTLLISGSDTINLYMGNAYTPTQWTSTKNSDTQYVEWNFNHDGLIVRADNPTVTLPYLARLDNPILSAVNGSQVVEYQEGKAEGHRINWFRLGGENQWTVGGSATIFGLGNYDVFKNDAASAGIAINMIPKELNGNDGIDGLKGIGNRFDKPVAPIVIRNVYIFCGNPVAKDNESVRLNIYKMNNGTKEATPIATAEQRNYTFITKYTDKKSGNTYDINMIPFSFSDPVEIDSEYFIEFVNYKSAAFLSQGISNADGTNYAYLVFDNKITPVADHSYMDIAGNPLKSAFYVTLDAVFPYIHSEESTTKQFSAAGGSNRFKMTAYGWDPNTYWTLENKAQMEAEGWITLGKFTADASGIRLPVQVAALPANVSSRKFDLKYKSYASSITLTIDQNRNYAGIESLSKELIKASYQNDYFCLEYPADAYQTVSIYNVAGQKVKEHQLNATGTVQIPVSGLPKGIYILKFGGAAGQSVKIVKG